MLNKLILGTANFGMSYGIANRKKLSDKQIEDILKTATDYNIWGIDTASGYGNAEKLLGGYLQNTPLSVITKLPYRRYLKGSDIFNEVKKSLKNLNINKIDILLIHSFENYRNDKDVIIKEIESLIKQDIVKRWGVSVYFIDEVLEVLNDGFTDFVVEFPVNLFDRRFLSEDFLKLLKKKGCFLIARSVFLQGLFMIKPELLKGNLTKVKDNIKLLDQISLNQKIPIPTLALLFVLKQKFIDKVIIGVDSKNQLISNIAALKYLNRYKNIVRDLNALQVNDENILLPYRWKIKIKKFML